MKYSATIVVQIMTFGGTCPRSTFKRELEEPNIPLSSGMRLGGIASRPLTIGDVTYQYDHDGDYVEVTMVHRECSGEEEFASYGNDLQKNGWELVKDEPGAQHPRLEALLRGRTHD